MPLQRSPFSGELVNMPERKTAHAPVTDQLAELRVQLATETTRREAAEARCADLEARLTEADKRAERIAADLERANGRIASLAVNPVQKPQSITFPAPPPPVGYTAIVTARDGNGKIKTFDLLPKR